MIEENVPETLPAKPVSAAPAEPAVTTFPEPDRLLLHMPVDIRNMSLMVLAGLAILFVLHWAKAVFIPVMLGVLFSYALSPVVNWLELKRVPRWLSSAVLLLAIFGAIGSTTWSLRDNAAQLVESLPVAAQKFRNATKVKTGQSDSTLDTVQKAASQIEQATQDGAKPGNTRGAMRVVVERASFNVKDYLWTGTIGLITLIGQAVAVIFLTYFLLLSGDSFRRKLLKLAGPSLSKKKVTLQALHEITGQIQRYLQVQLLTSALVGVLTWLALLAIGLENAAVWGIAAFVLNFVPYVGSLITAAATALVGFLQFGTLNMALVVGGASLVIHTIVGNLITPWLTSRASRLSPVAVFVGLLAWGWLWGVWGLLLGVPILMMVKSVCDRVDDLKPLGEFLGP
ncbi:MAG: AI-2E family transporter [Polaromonas sp.]|uniref:AI-2E family transporter n=1 Tax=Polaromonas sp. TaxID=1869339 RepID=UPI00271A0C17|nr:AI-2E family transporter [Polaromonas sp.]MDO9112232.1 AI-2E family transporter [Polaromonas sp.]MDP1887047.1 AI-2E family transporter [Polaromonas sp.]MDP2450060.1 AI-2E family transporter [Polaromonas sp.]MDP3247543.1 AI-2E family transporter [Polaromonas sp.]MDP3755338.1 AI-2E family transporter [Polaromonas sp.]